MLGTIRWRARWFWHGQPSRGAERHSPLFACVTGALAGVLLVISLRPASTLPPATSILFVGDSLTLGIAAVDPAHDYEQLLLDRLRQDQPLDWAQTVIEHPYGLVDNAELRAAPYLSEHPQLILVEVGTHDVQAPPAQQALFAARYAHLLNHLAESGARIIVATLPWLGYPPGGHDYADALRFNQIIQADAAARHYPVVDLWQPTVGDYAILSTPEDPTFEPPYRGDFFHPDDLGHRILANAFWPVLDRVTKHQDSSRPDVRVPFTMPQTTLGRSEEQDE